MDTSIYPTRLSAGRGTIGCHCQRSRDFIYTPPAGTAIASSSQTLFVLFAPTDTTDYTTVSLSVALTVTSEPMASVSPSSINFGTLYLGAIVIHNVTVTNVGNAPMTIAEPLFSFLHGGDSSEYGAVNLCPKSLAAGKSTPLRWASSRVRSTLRRQQR